MMTSVQHCKSKASFFRSVQLVLHVHITMMEQRQIHQCMHMHVAKLMGV